MVDIDFLHGGNIYKIKRRYKKDVIDFSANINPLGLPAELKKAISIDFDTILHLAPILLNDKDYIERTRRLINEEREFLFNKFAGIEALRPYPSVANFLLVKILSNGMDSSILTNKLIEKGILIRDCSNFRNLNKRYIRVAVRSHKENLKLIRALGELLCKS